MAQQVFISAHLAKVPYGKSVYRDLTQKLAGRIHEISSHSNNIWCRDYMPVKSANGRYIQFTYQPAYMSGMDKYKDNFPDRNKIKEELELDIVSSEIVLDGGAIEICGKKGTVSDRVFRDNPNKTAAEIYSKLKKLLVLDELIVIPQYPYDFTGHVDGLVRFIDENSVVVNDLKKELDRGNAYKNHDRRKVAESWVYSFQSALVSAGLKLEELPDSVPEKGSPNSGEGIYINFLLLPNLILMPAYGNDKDNLAAKKLKDLYKKEVIQINAKKLSQMGGMINCVTWTS